MRHIRIDTVLDRIGGFGRWQRLQLTFLAPSSVFVCWAGLVYVFIAPYGYSSIDCNNHTSIERNGTIGWDDDDGGITHTTITQWNLLCNRRWLRPLQQVCYSIGASLGVACFYYLSNRFGRKRPLLLSTLLLTILGSVTPYSHFHNLFCTLRFVTGFFIGGIRICSLFLSLETCSTRYHPWILSIWDCVHAIGYILLASVASISSDWRSVYAASTVPVIILFSYACLIPESPRFLLIIRRKADAERILRKVASTNGHILRHESTQHISVSERELVVMNAYTFRHVVNDYQMCLWFVQMLACWFLSFTVYYTFAFTIPFIGDDHIFQLHSWAGFVELPAIGLSFFTAMYVQRRKLCLIASIGCGICSALAAIIDSSAPYAATAVMALIAKSSMVVYVSTLQLLTLEMLPKEIRYQLMAIIATISNATIGGSSVLAMTAEIFHPFPFIGCAIASFLVSGLTLLLPETYHRSGQDEDKISTIDVPAMPGHAGEEASVEMMDLRSKERVDDELETERTPDVDV